MAWILKCDDVRVVFVLEFRNAATTTLISANEGLNAIQYVQ